MDGWMDGRIGEPACSPLGCYECMMSVRCAFFMCADVCNVLQCAACLWFEHLDDVPCNGACLFFFAYAYIAHMHASIRARVHAVYIAVVVLQTQHNMGVLQDTMNWSGGSNPRVCDGSAFVHM